MAATVTRIAPGAYRIETPSGRLTLSSDELADVEEQAEDLLWDERAGTPVDLENRPAIEE